MHKSNVRVRLVITGFDEINVLQISARSVLESRGRVLCHLSYNPPPLAVLCHTSDNPPPLAVLCHTSDNPPPLAGGGSRGRGLKGGSRVRGFPLLLRNQLLILLHQFSYYLRFCEIRITSCFFILFKAV